jgi:tRNA G18 (ribose-2'-O)-methylase SpoU
MRKLTHSEIRQQRKDLSNLNSFTRNPIYCLCENIRSIYNVGAIFRTSDGAFIEKIFLTGYTPHPPRKEIEKIALGATLSVPWEYRRNSLEVINELKSKNVKICALEITDEKKLIYDITKNDFPLCLIIGNEITGVSKELLNLADIAVELPMFGIKHSLNVAVAYGIAVYELIRKLHFNNQ